MKQASKSANPAAQVPPDKLKLTNIQAQRLSGLTNINAKEFTNNDIAGISEKLKWRIDPDLFLFRRICGQVVRRDPVSGLDQPVPFATVHVMDTECDFLGYFPFDLPWVWCFPIFCEQEEITSVVTDECGRFCVWIPRFDIDWVIRWRLERFCYPEIFVKPTLGDILKNFGVIPEQEIPPHGPGPDPAPFILKDGGLTLERVAHVAGRQTALKLAAAESAAAIGGKSASLKELLSQRGFSHPVPPPIPAKLREVYDQHRKQDRKALAGLVKDVKNRDYKLDLNHYVGPFLRWRCEWELREELVPILGVPDITFWVTQDTDGDGDQETIYSDGYFDVGWSSGPLSSITLHASAIARPSSSCNVPPMGDCGEPMIHFAGLMPTTAAYMDMATGFAIRPNPPHADALIRSSVFPPALHPDTPSTAPFMGTVQLYGCNHYPGGQYYRLLYSYNGAAPVPFTNIAWWIDPWPIPGIPLHVVPDAQGWYPILATPTDWFPPYELLDWPTSNFPDGLYQVTMQIGDGAKNPIFTTPTAIPFLLDNSAPPPQFLSLAWRVAGTIPWNYFPSLVCPVVHRPTSGGVPVDIEFRVEYAASMPHLLKVTLAGSGCGAGAPTLLSSPNWSDPASAAFVAGVSQNPASHWHTDQFDNFVSRAAVFSLPGAALQGAYGFGLSSYSRAFNPSGGDAGDPQAHDWYFDAQSLSWSYSFLPIAVVNI